MLTKDVDITLENLLNLALGTPEIGAVNFNYLHEVVTEILKHLGISKKLVGITQEVDYRLVGETARKSGSSTVHHKQSVQKHSSEDSIAETPQQTAITSPPDNVDDVGTNEITKQHSLEKNSIDGSEPAMDGKEQRQPSVGHMPTPPTQRKSSVIATRRSSTGNGGQRLPMKDSKNQDIAIANRTIERRDSKTPAGDMWHVLNINRRVEAAEAAIQGMTNLIDTINSDMQDLKNVQEESTDILPEQTQEAASSKQEQETVNKIVAKLKICDGKISELDGKIDGLITKDQIESFCTIDEVHAMILEKFDSLMEPGNETVEQADTTESANSDELTALVQQVKQQPKISTHLLHKLSKDNMPYREMSKKIMNLEEEIKQAKARVNQLELDKQAPTTTDESTNNAEVPLSHQELEKLMNKVVTLEATHNKMVDDIVSVTSQNEDLTAEQKSLTVAFEKLARNLEDMSDNFHRTQSNLMKRQRSNNEVDEGAIMMINGAMFELQQQHSKFQNDVDALSQMVKKKDGRTNEINDLIKQLEETKVDKEYVNKQLEGKADRKMVENKVSRDQFDGCVGEIDRNIQDMLQKFDEMIGTMTQEFTSLLNALSKKADRDEINEIKVYIDNRFKTFKPKIPTLPQSAESTPAGTRKKLLPGCNCISCDRTVDVPATHAGLVLPGFQPLPVRPVTTVDLQKMRQQMQQPFYGNNRDRFDMTKTREKLQKELLQLCGVGNLDELVTQTNRACGGVHTLVEQHRRNPGKQPIFYPEEHAAFQQDDRQLFETDVLGRDGHIYKGRVHSPALPQIKNKGNADNQIMPRPSMLQNGSGKVSPKAEIVT